jgi:CTP:molybdopterin cytidylyltransferase MocA
MTLAPSTTADVAAVIMAAGRGSRMKGYDGNKTLLPLVPGASIHDGERPLLLHLMDNLPPGPKAVVVHHCKEAVIQLTAPLGVTHCEQPRLNGTGGAILAAADFIDTQPCDRVIITMGDVPFVEKKTYADLVLALDENDFAVLGFQPEDKKQYGVVEIASGKVQKITEWKYWKDIPPGGPEGACNLQFGHLRRLQGSADDLSSYPGLAAPGGSQRDRRQNDPYRGVFYYRSDRMHGGRRQERRRSPGCRRDRDHGHR